MYSKLRPFSPTTSQKHTTIHWLKSIEPLLIKFFQNYLKSRSCGVQITFFVNSTLSKYHLSESLLHLPLSFCKLWEMFILSITLQSIEKVSFLSQNNINSYIKQWSAWHLLGFDKHILPCVCMFGDVFRWYPIDLPEVLYKRPALILVGIKLIVYCPGSG